MRNFALVILLILLCGTAHAEVAIPPWTQYAIDLTGTLTPQQLQALNQRLAALEARKGAQIGVLIVPTTRPEAHFQFTMRVFESWKPGRKGIDDGLLLMVAKNDDYYFLMTGYGMEGAVPDVKARHIVTDIIIPRVKSAGYYAGIDAGLSALIEIVDKEPLPPPVRDHSSDECSGEKPPGGVAIPPWTQHVIDLDGALDPGRLQALNRRLEAYEYRKGAQIGVLIVPTSYPESIEQFAMRVCGTWKLGRDGVDDGVLVTMSRDDKQLNITVGRGLEKVLDNAKLAQILNEIIAPNLMLSEFDAGIGEGVEAIIKVVDTVPLTPPDHSLMASVSRNFTPYFEKYFGVFILISLFGIVVLHRYTSRLKSGGSMPD